MSYAVMLPKWLSRSRDRHSKADDVAIIGPDMSHGIYDNEAN